MRAIRIQTAAGHEVLVAVDDSVQLIGEAAAGGTVAAAKDTPGMVKRLTDIGLAIADVCKAVQEKAISALGDAKPTELSLEFGVKLAGEASIPLITSSSIEGTFQVTAKWDLSKEGSSERV